MRYTIESHRPADRLQVATHVLIAPVTVLEVLEPAERGRRLRSERQLEHRYPEIFFGLSLFVLVLFPWLLHMYSPSLRFETCSRSGYPLKIHVIYQKSTEEHTHDEKVNS